MGLFDDVLGAGESLFRNEDALEYEFLPKLLPFREDEQHELARLIAPLLEGRNGRNALIHGAPGIGKTAAARFVLRELEEKTEDILVCYVNCWQANTSYKVLMELCDQLGFKFTQNKNSQELMKTIASIVNKKAAVFIFDEIDKAEEQDFLYSLLEDLFKKSLILITNYKSWLIELDERIKSRLTPELIEFRQYNEKETRGILAQRMEYAFVPDVWEDDAFLMAVDKAASAQDIRTGLYLMRQAALKAEAKASKKVTAEHVELALGAMDEFTIKSSTDLSDEEKFIWEIVKQHDGKKIGDLYNQYKKDGGKASYKTFQRKIASLDEGKFITLERKTGEGGNTTIVNKKITDF
jgi:cell division control protein 6